MLLVINTYTFDNVKIGAETVQTMVNVRQIGTKAVNPEFVVTIDRIQNNVDTVLYCVSLCQKSLPGARNFYTDTAGYYSLLKGEA